MVTIRLQRRGRKKRPIHHIVVADSRSPRDGRIVEDLGRFNNLPVKNEVTLNEERVIYWLKQGAQPSDTVRSIFKKQGILYKMHLIRWGKSEEEIEAALDEWRAKRAEKEEKTPSKKERQRAMLEAEEKEYQKQLKKQAEEAAREKAKEEALAKEQEEAAAKAKIEQEAPSEAQETEAEQADEAQEEAVEAKAEEIEEVDVKTTQSGELAAGAEVDQDEVDAAVEEDEEAGSEPEEAQEAADSADEDVKEQDTDAQVSTDMLAKDAIDHIKNTPLDELEGFITEDESRVTVRRALEEKQEG